MKLVLIFVVVFVLVVTLEARRGRQRNGSHDGHRRGGRWSGGRMKIALAFPECQDFVNLIIQKKIEMMDEGEIGPAFCQNKDRGECMMKDIEKIRCSIETKPSQECMKKITDFMEGVCPDGAEGGEEGEGEDEGGNEGEGENENGNESEGGEQEQ